ncbi:MAG TPA: hypothetical protein VF543_12250 [Pyrinomonadaceae bacterium]|jgi:hypothetical protein
MNKQEKKETSIQEPKNVNREDALHKSDDSTPSLSILKMEVRALSNVVGGGVIFGD